MSIEGWLETTLGDLVENFDSLRQPVKRSDRRPGPYPYYGASGIVDHVDGHLFDGEYLLVAEDGENLNTRKTPVAFIARGKFWVNNHAHVLRGRLRADTRFLAYCIESNDIDGYVTGSAQPKLSQGNLHAMRLVVPPPSERAAIARVLGALDDKIEQNRKMREALEATCQAIFKSWFVDFDPVVAKAEGRQPACLAPAVADLFPGAFHENEWGALPVGWDSKEIDAVIKLSRSAVSPGRFPMEAFAHFSIPAWDEGKRPRLENGAFIKSNKFAVPESSILVSKLNPQIPRVWLPDPPATCRAIASTEFLVAVPRSADTRHFLYHAFCSSAFADEFALLVTGTSNSHQRVKPEDFLAIRIPWPPPPVQRAFVRFAEPLTCDIASNLRQSATLSALRDALMPRLLSGELRVRQAESLVEEAT